MKATRLKRPSGTWAPPIYLEKQLHRSVAARLRPLGGPFVISEPGIGEGPPRAKPEAIDKFTDRLMTSPVGTHLQVRNKAELGIHGRVVEVAPTIVNTTGSPGVDILVGFLNAEFAGDWESWGIYVYKHIANSSTWSDHSYVGTGWCGRAIDIHPRTVAIGDAIHAKTTSDPNIMAHLRYVLWRGVPNHYPGHLHYSFDDGGAPGPC